MYFGVWPIQMDIVIGNHYLLIISVFLIIGIGLSSGYGPKVVEDKNPTYGEKIGFGFGITFLIIFVPVVFWQLKRTYETTIGAESLFSNIFVFKLYSEQGNSFASTSNIDIIKGLIGDDNYDNFFGSNGELKSFTSAISLVTVDGQEIPLVQLYDIINKIEQNQINIIEVKSE